MSYPDDVTDEMFLCAIEQNVEVRCPECEARIQRLIADGLVRIIEVLELTDAGVAAQEAMRLKWERSTDASS